MAPYITNSWHPSCGIFHLKLKNQRKNPNLSSQRDFSQSSFLTVWVSRMSQFHLQEVWICHPWQKWPREIKFSSSSRDTVFNVVLPLWTKIRHRELTIQGHFHVCFARLLVLNLDDLEKNRNLRNYAKFPPFLQNYVFLRNPLKLMVFLLWPGGPPS